MQQAREKFTGAMGRMKRGAYTEESQRFLAAVEKSDAAHEEALGRIIAMRRGDAAPEAVVRAYDEQAAPRRDQLRTDLNALVDSEDRLLDDATRDSTDTATAA